MPGPDSTNSAARTTPLKALVDSARFNAFIIGVIVFNAVLIGWYTYDPAPWILTLEWICIGIFIVELVLRFIARDSTKAFFSDGWTIFDILIVASAFIPASGGVVPIVRILRVFRVLRLVKTIPELRLIVTVLVKSVGSMKYIGLLAVILFYVYAVIGVKLFGAPGHALQQHFATIHEACFTLFRILTGDDWTQMRYDLIEKGGSTAAFTAYQVTWIILATFILVNLIVGAIINNYQQVQDVEQHRTGSSENDERRLREILDEAQAIMKRRQAS